MLKYLKLFRLQNYMLVSKLSLQTPTPTITMAEVAVSVTWSRFITRLDSQTNLARAVTQDRVHSTFSLGTFV